MVFGQNHCRSHKYITWTRSLLGEFQLGFVSSGQLQRTGTCSRHRKVLRRKLKHSAFCFSLRYRKHKQGFWKLKKQIRKYPFLSLKLSRDIIIARCQKGFMDKDGRKQALSRNPDNIIIIIIARTAAAISVSTITNNEVNLRKE